MFQQTKTEWQFEVMQKIKKVIRQENEIWRSVTQSHSPTPRAADSLKAGETCQPDDVKVESSAPAESG